MPKWIYPKQKTDYQKMVDTFKNHKVLVYDISKEPFYIKIIGLILLIYCIYLLII